MNQIYTVRQLEEYLATLPLGSEAVKTIVEFADMQDNAIDEQRKRCNVAAKILGHDMISEYLDDE